MKHVWVAACLISAASVCGAQATASPLVEGKVEGLYYLDGFSGVKFAKLPAACAKNKSGWVISSQLDQTTAWEVLTAAYIKGAKVWVALDLYNGLCNGAWAVSTHKLSIDSIRAHDKADARPMPESPAGE